MKKYIQTFEVGREIRNTTITIEVEAESADEAAALARQKFLEMDEETIANESVEDEEGFYESWDDYRDEPYEHRIKEVAE